MTKLFVLPGIVGSRLASPDESQTWGDLRGTVESLIDPSLLALKPNEPAWRPMSLVSGRVYAKGMQWLTDHGKLFRGLMGKLNQETSVPTWQNPSDGVNPAAKVVLVPYDFRQSVKESARWLGQVIDAWAPNQYEPVRIAAHSMGGLVASWWFAAEEGWRKHRDVRAVTVGTPHRGAPIALQWLTEPTAPLKGREIMETLRTWPSVYELLPRYKMIKSGDQWLRPCELSTGDAPVFTGFLDKAKAAMKFHLDLDAAWRSVPDQRKRDFSCHVGHGLRTISSAIMSADGLEFLKDRPQGVPNGEECGDGTVPRISAHRWDLVTTQLHRGVKHRTLWHDTTTIGAVESFFVDNAPAIRGGSEPLAPYLDVDVPDAVAAGDEVSITARVSPDAPLAPKVKLRAIVKHGGTQGVPVNLHQIDSNSFTGRLHFPLSGTYKVTIETGDTPTRPPVKTTCPVIALSEEELLS